MNDDDDLFNRHPAETRARKTDPWTSHAAAMRVIPTLNDRQQKVLAIHKEHTKGLTNWELEIICGNHNSTWRTRVSELVDLGLVVDSHRTKRIFDSDDPRSERVVWIYAQYADPYLIEPMPERPETRAEPVKSQSAYIDRHGRLVTRCLICGSSNAPYGYGVSLRKDQLGEHYCGLHRPEEKP